MAIDEAYMLPRNPEESRRLDQQHEFLRALAHGELIHQAVPRQSLRAVADIGTGTGVWLQETARELANSQPRPEGIEYKGFDISPSQLPDQNVSGVEFVVHDAAKAFPSQYHTKFDLVHVRLLSYATRAQELSLVVENIVQIMKPGGFLQWEECDAIDSWAVPETEVARSIIANVVSERIVTPLIKTIQSLTTPVPPGKLSPLSWSEDILRIMHLETLSTTAHPSPLVQRGKGHAIKAAALQFLQIGVSRKRDKAVNSVISNAEAENLKNEILEMTKLVEDIKEDGKFAQSEWNMAMTRIVARKANILRESEPWMHARYIS